MNEKRPIVAWLGTGLMGTPMATRLLESGWRVRVWNRTREKARQLGDAGAQICTTPAAAVDAAEWVFTTLSDYQATNEILDQTGLSGKVLIQMATIAPDQSRALAQLTANKGGQYLEAPVLGSIPEASSGRLIIMAGGAEWLFQAIRPALEVLGESPRLIGEVGQAAALKLALNQLIASLTVAFSTSLAYVTQEQVAVETFMEILRESALSAPTFDKKISRMISHDYSAPNFPTEHLVKDIGLFLHSASEITTAPLEVIENLYESALKEHRFEDYSCVFEAVTRKDDS